MRMHARVWWLVVGSVAVLAAAFCVAWWLDTPMPLKLGFTFSTDYARYLGLDPQAAFRDLLDALDPAEVRIPVYWKDIEPKDGIYVWDELDGLMRAAQEHGTPVVLAIGEKVPRWPECYVPDWASSAPASIRNKQLEDMLTAVVNRYRESPVLARWQVENEPLFRFGVCPDTNPQELMREISLVKSLDRHPVELTVSGELEFWVPSARLADVLGTSLYRRVWTPYGFMIYPIPPWFYRARAFLVHSLVSEVVVSELQAEPWLPNGMQGKSPSELAAAFPPAELDANILYAAQTGISTVDVWGVEWWYYLKLHGESDLWNEGVNVFHP